MAAIVEDFRKCYISGPGQACTYKLGPLKIRDLRGRAKQWLRPKFDLKTFHEEILSGGALPLDVLDARIDRWIKAQVTAKAWDSIVGIPKLPFSTPPPESNKPGRYD